MNRSLDDGATLTVDTERAGEDRARADHYALLARLFFAAPDADLLAAIARSGRSFGQGALAHAWQALASAAGSTTADAAQGEFDRLFVGIGRPEVMPYGSFYLTGFMMEEPLAELREDLARLGLARRHGVAESEDHVAALSEVMRHLIVTGPDAAGIERQRAFFERHLRPWYAALTDSLASRDDTPFYARVAALARAFYDVENEAFAMD